MPFPITPKEVFDNEYGDDFLFWFPTEKSNPNNFFPTPYDWGLVWFLFTNEKDAEHFGFLLERLAPGFKGKEMIAVSDTKREVVSTIAPVGTQMVLIPRNGALQFFQEYEQFMARYYGFEDNTGNKSSK